MVWNLKLARPEQMIVSYETPVAAAFRQIFANVMLGAALYYHL
jgi:hypothetical protein